MFKKFKLSRKISRCKKNIKLIEKRRSRSQAALVEAILSNSVPDDADVDYFNQYTAQITNIRDQLREYQRTLDGLKLNK